MTVSINVGTRFPAYATSMGRVLLAGLPDEALDAYLERVDARAAVPAHDRLARTRCGRARQGAPQGWALVDQELEEGLRSIAAPIRDRGGRRDRRRQPLRAREPHDDRRGRGATLLPPLLATAARIEADLRVGPQRSPAVGRRMTTTTTRPPGVPAGEPRRTGVAIAIVLLGAEPADAGGRASAAAGGHPARPRRSPGSWAGC